MKYSVIVSIFLLFIVVSPFSFATTTAKQNSNFTGSYQPVKPGADRLFSEYVHLIKEKKVALVTNHSGRLSDGTHLADTLFNYPDAELIVLFGMGYNIRSNDYSVPRDKEKDIDQKTGLPKYSLYGSTHKPTPEMLKDVEVIVFDIQEVGARFYEHINILGFVMEAAAENDIEIIVLDRPNPITGLRADGFITDDEFLYGFGSFGKVPVIHGMTMGELADRLSHPSNNIRKIYKVEIDKPLESEHLEQISAGFSLEDGPVMIDEIAVLTADAKSIGIEIHSGRNRVVRRIFEHFDNKVECLDRTVYAGLTKMNLTRGKWRHLSDKEVGLLKKKGKKR